MQLSHGKQGPEKSDAVVFELHCIVVNVVTNILTCFGLAFECEKKMSLLFVYLCPLYERLKQFKFVQIRVCRGVSRFSHLSLLCTSLELSPLDR